jgi:AmmeMemoRadiSam system protein B
MTIEGMGLMKRGMAEDSRQHGEPGRQGAAAGSAVRAVFATGLALLFLLAGFSACRAGNLPHEGQLALGSQLALEAPGAQGAPNAIAPQDTQGAQEAQCAPDAIAPKDATDASSAPDTIVLKDAADAPGAFGGSQNPAKQYIECIHYDERGFFKAVEKSGPYSIEGEMLAATSPHFLPTMSFTANILGTLAQEEKPGLTIFVVAPNHSGEGLPLIVSDRGWATPFGHLETDGDAVAAILGSPYLADKTDIDLFHLKTDHSAATLMPFIKYYLPDAQVVTILIGRDCGLGQLQALAEIIYETGRKKPVFTLASVDFSHYLYIGETAKRDEATDSLIRAGDVQAIKELDDGNMDSPESVIALMDYVAFFRDVQAERPDHVILPESEIEKDIGYSYSVYVFTKR